MICKGSEDGSLRIWDPTSDSSTRVVQGHQFHAALLTCISHDSRVAIAGSVDTKPCLVNLDTGTPIGSLAGHFDTTQCTSALSGFSDWLQLVQLMGS